MKKQRPGEAKLRAALRRFSAVITAAPPETSPDDPLPATAWEQAAAARLLAIEIKLANQNRLLLLTSISIVADMLVRFNSPSPLADWFRHMLGK